MTWLKEDGDLFQVVPFFNRPKFCGRPIKSCWKHRFTKTHKICQLKPPKSMLVIHFSHLFKLYWWFVMNVNYHQQSPPYLGFYSSSIKGWIIQDITLRQDVNIKLFLVMHALQDSKCLPWNFGWLKNGIAWNRSPSSLVKSIGETF